MKLIHSAWKKQVCAYKYEVETLNSIQTQVRRN